MKKKPKFDEISRAIHVAHALATIEALEIYKNRKNSPSDGRFAEKMLEIWKKFGKLK